MSTYEESCARLGDSQCPYCDTALRATLDYRRFTIEGSSHPILNVPCEFRCPGCGELFTGTVFFSPDWANVGNTEEGHSPVEYGDADELYFFYDQSHDVWGRSPSRKAPARRTTSAKRASTARKTTATRKPASKRKASKGARR